MVEIAGVVQVTADGSVAADCSSGTCECSTGFIDNGDGCVAMTEEQAATTEAPTEAPKVVDWLPTLVAKLETVQFSCSQ